MGVLAQVANDPVAAQQWASGGAAIKPPRLNFARSCVRCDERDCVAPECDAWHAQSYWAVCPECDGICWKPNVEPCGCMVGVVEAYPPPTPARAAAHPK
jgi:hypothetical protein